MTVANVIHDLTTRQSFVTMVWDSDPTKKVALPVPYGVSLADLRDEAERALRALSAETASLPVNTPA